MATYLGKVAEVHVDRLELLGNLAARAQECITLLCELGHLSLLSDDVRELGLEASEEERVLALVGAVSCWG